MVICMKFAPSPDPDTLPKPFLPAWIMHGSGTETLEDAVFSCGSALALLHMVLHDPNIQVPAYLLRNRQALRAAQNCCKLEGRTVSEADLRDAFLLAAPGDARGPDGDMLALWSAVTRYGLRRSDWIERYVTSCPVPMREFLADLFVDTPEALLRGTPVAQASNWASPILKTFPRQEAIALQCADIALAKALGWPHAVPLCALYLKRGDFRKLSDGDAKGFELAFTASVARAANDATRLAHDLARRARRLKSVASILRSKGSEDALKLFLSEDAVYPPTMLTPTIRGSNTTMTDRSARRFCDRLVELGVARELTGRSTFRLYGVA